MTKEFRHRMFFPLILIPETGDIECIHYIRNVKDIYYMSNGLRTL